MSSTASTMPTTMPSPFAPPGLRRITVDEYERIIREARGSDRVCALVRCWTSVGAIPTRQLGRSSR